MKKRAVLFSQQRPYIILKYAQSTDNFIGQTGKQVWLSNNITKIVSHKWRSEIDAILVGTNTAATDDPALTNRLYFGSSPLRLVIDKTLRLTKDLQLFDQKQPTWVFTSQKAPKEVTNLKYIEVSNKEDYLTAICHELYLNGKKKLMVEGGASLLQSFIDAEMWDEARIFKTPVLLKKGIEAPRFKGKLITRLKLKDNYLEQWTRSK